MAPREVIVPRQRVSAATCRLIESICGGTSLTKLPNGPEFPSEDDAKSAVEAVVLSLHISIESAFRFSHGFQSHSQTHRFERASGVAARHGRTPSRTLTTFPQQPLQPLRPTLGASRFAYLPRLCILCAFLTEGYGLPSDTGGR